MKKLRPANLALVIFFATAACATPNTDTPSTGAPWAQITTGDLDRLQRAIIDNHPGMIDAANSEFRLWATEGMTQAKARAASAKNFYDYKRVMHFYTNGFHDNHVEVRPNVDSLKIVWPGFLPKTRNSALEVGLSQRDEIPAGAKIISCDGQDAWRLLEQNVLPYRWNSEIPHQLDMAAAYLTMVDAGDTPLQFKKCTFEIGDQAQTVDLTWEPMPAEDADRLRREALGWANPPVGLRKISGLWFVSMSTFQLYTEKQIADYKAFLDDIEAHRNQLRNETIVLDLRGVPGGVSSWGNEVAKRIWRQDWVDYIEGKLGKVIEWRVSPDNLERHKGVVKMLKRDGLEDYIPLYETLVAEMETALKDGKPFVQIVNAEEPAGLPSVNPVKGKVYLLTDGICASACLDFVDLTIRMPGVVHIGLPTAADTMYMENAFVELPSGLSRLTYSQKVYRDRVRGRNEWYEPKVKWPGGVMTDDAVAAWINTIE